MNATGTTIAKPVINFLIAGVNLLLIPIDWKDDWKP